MESSSEFLQGLNILSSGWENADGVHEPTVFSYLFSFLGAAGDWAGAVSDLVGLVS